MRINAGAYSFPNVECINTECKATLSLSWLTSEKIFACQICGTRQHGTRPKLYDTVTINNRVKQLTSYTYL